MALFRRRDDATPATPAPPSHAQTVAGLPVEVHTPPFVVDARLTGYLGQPAFAVRPRTPSGPDVPVPPAAAGLLDVVGRSGREIVTGDAAFDARYAVSGGDPAQVTGALDDALRAALLGCDVGFLVVHSGGAWVSVAHGEPAGTEAAERAEQTALQVLALLAPA